MPPNQLPRSILLALGIVACDDKGVDSGDTHTHACLDYAYDTDTSPCLEPHYDTSDSGDTGDTGDTGDSGDTGDTGDTGDVGPCLAPKEDLRGDVAAPAGAQPVPPAVASAIEAARAVLRRGVLPEDVADLVRERRLRR